MRSRGILKKLVTVMLSLGMIFTALPVTRLTDARSIKTLSLTPADDWTYEPEGDAYGTRREYRYTETKTQDVKSDNKWSMTTLQPVFTSSEVPGQYDSRSIADGGTYIKYRSQGSYLMNGVQVTIKDDKGNTLTRYENAEQYGHSGDNGFVEFYTKNGTTFTYHQAGEVQSSYTVWDDCQATREFYIHHVKDFSDHYFRLRTNYEYLGDHKATISYDKNDTKKRAYLLFWTGKTTRLRVVEKVFLINPSTGDYYTNDEIVRDDANGYYNRDGVKVAEKKHGVIGQQMLIDSSPYVQNNNAFFFTYCCDHAVGSPEGGIYDVVNLEEATYFDDVDIENAAKFVRFFAVNGYWGTADNDTTPDHSNPSMGSMNYFIKFLKDKAASRAQKDPSFVNSDMYKLAFAENGITVNYNGGSTNVKLDGLTPGEGVLLTQIAIWHYGNSDKSTIVDEKHPFDGQVSNGQWYNNYTLLDNVKDRVTMEKRTAVIYDFMMSLNYEEATQTPDTTIITEANAFKKVTLDVKDRVNGGTNPENTSFTAPAGTQRDSGNDTYRSDLKIELGFTPTSTDNESLHLIVRQGENTIADEVVREGKLTYELKDIYLNEGEDIDVSLEGVHGVARSAYLYYSGEVKRVQTLVGVAGGTQNVKMLKTLKFDYIYVSDPAIEAVKKYDGGIQAGQFSFILKDDKDNTVVETTNDANGVIDFGNFEFTSEAFYSGEYEVKTDPTDGSAYIEHYYYASEVQPAARNIEFDQSVWKFTVRTKMLTTNGKVGTYTEMSSELIAIEKVGEEGTNHLNNGGAIFENHELTSINGKKIWQGDSEYAQYRPEYIVVRLLANNVYTGKSLTVRPDASGNWTYEFTGLRKYDDSGKLINYTVSENPVNGYTTTYDGYNTINTLEKINISGKKTWVDSYHHDFDVVAEDNDGVRPDHIVVHLTGKVNNTVVVERTLNVTPDPTTGDWNYSFTNLPKYLGGKEVVYTVSETPVDEYNTEITGYNITNTHEPLTTEIPVEKKWEDHNNYDGIRPRSIVVNLTGTVGNTVVLRRSAIITPDANGNWNYTFKDLPVYYKGSEINYSVAEVAVPGYTRSVVTYDQKLHKYIITNYHEPLRTISGQKIWKDENNNDGVRPDHIDINLYADGDLYDTIRVYPDEFGNWDYSFEDLPVYAEGKEITYTVEEVPSQTQSLIDTYNYEPSVVPTSYGFNIINTRDIETVKVSGTKTWKDSLTLPDGTVLDNADGIRPTSITLQLYADDLPVEGKTVTIRPNASGVWPSYEFTGLPKYRDGGVLINYTVKETAVNGYTTTYSDPIAENNVITINIENTHVPKTTHLHVEKEWDDEGNNDGFRPEKIVLDLYGEIFVTGNNGEMPAVIYLEDTVYYPALGFNPEEGNYDVVRVYEEKGVEITPDANGDWEHDFNNLPKTVSILKNGVYTTYTVYYHVEERRVNNFYQQPTYELTNDGIKITNTHVTVKTQHTVVKVWDDEDNKYNYRPTQIEAYLYAMYDGEKTLVYEEPAILNEGNNWTYTWKNLPFYHNGQGEVYYFAEEVVPYPYEVTYSEDKRTTIMTNKLPELTEYTVEKIWEDQNNAFNTRPEGETVTVQLYKTVDGEKVTVGDPVVLAEDNGKWEYTWTGLIKYEGEEEIQYSADELDVPADYEKTVVTEDGKTIITNTAPEYTKYRVYKVWVDQENPNPRPVSVTVQLYSSVTVDGVEVKLAEGEPVVLSEENEWTYLWDKLPVKDENGNTIKYTVEEEVPADYTESQKTETTDVNSDEPYTIVTTITNTYINLGDTRSLPVYTAMTAAGALGAIATLILMKRTKEEEDEE